MPPPTPGRPSSAGTLAKLRSVDRDVKVLLLTDLGFNLGFYMLMPYLAGHLRGLAIQGSLVGLILGLRNLSQQGLFLIGGALADRREYRSIIVTGCLVRSAGFALFGFASHPATLLAASVLTGLAAALFTPALKAYLATVGSEERPMAFALSGVLSQVGALLGPLLGVALLSSGFRPLALASAALFLVWAALLRLALPERRGSEAASSRTARQDWKEAAANRPFLLFSFALGGYAVLFNQLYLALPLALARVSPSQTGVSAAFMVSSVLVIALQIRVAAFSEARLSPAASIALGLAVMGAGFAPLAAVSLAGVEDAAGVTAAALAGTAILTFGMMLAYPFTMNMIPLLAGERRLGVHYGIFYLAAGLSAGAGNLIIGRLFDESSGRVGAAPWLLLVSVGLASAAAVAALALRGALPGSAAEQKR
ncbi:MFS transporter [Sorangium sp. So ce590]|uniref:MFS transporter n=1 Tax=unclassified Sorangium TaxID=2621164 RepID=UPI003F5F575A